MLIQEFGCPDLIIARQLLLAEFCNTIDPERTSLVRDQGADEDGESNFALGHAEP